MMGEGKITCISPSTLEVIGEVKFFSEEEVGEAVKKAREAQREWGKLQVKERTRSFEKLRLHLIEKMDEVVEVLQNEIGKPRYEALISEIVPVLLTAQYLEKHAHKILKRRRTRYPSIATRIHKSYIEYEPLGVIGIIAPWNYPFAIPGTQILAALAAGNAVVLKPSEYASMVGLKLKEIFDGSNAFPENLIQVVTGGGPTGAALVSSGVDKIIFTGSVKTGIKIMKQAADTLTPVVLELGGKDPMIIFKDADIERAVKGAVWGAFTNSGQVCASVERLYVEEPVYDYVVQRIIEETKKLRQGHELNNQVDIGSMTTEFQLRHVESQVEDAIKNGAKVLTGGKKLDAGGLFFEPTVLVDVNHSMKIMREETFGPVLPIMKFKTEDEAISLANDSEYGLNAYVWTGPIEHGFEVAKKLQAGTVVINNVLWTYGAPDTPWGGVKKSGIGRTHGEAGLLELVEMKHINVNRNIPGADLWWYPYSDLKHSAAREAIKSFFHPSLLERLKGFFKVLKIILKSNRRSA